jgi:L-threonylcarbamoyladenylate synthase
VTESATTIAAASRALGDGELVAFPTETVYGLGADASNASALAHLYAVKARPSAHPVIVHFASAARAFTWARVVPESARVLAQTFWPGPLTLLLPRAAHVLDAVTGAQDSVGLRVPSHPIAQQLLRAFDQDLSRMPAFGIAAPSANRFGRISPTTAQHVRDDLGADVSCVLEGGACDVGIESTIVDCTRAVPVVLRPGLITEAQIAQALKKIPPLIAQPATSSARGALAQQISTTHAGRNHTPRVSGALASHYAPRTPAHLIETHALDTAIARYAGHAAVLAFSHPDERVDFWLRLPRQPKAYAQGLYAALRELDQAQCQVMLVEAPPDTPEWQAVLDRLRRACHAASASDTQ